jgi:hypothetical protein
MTTLTQATPGQLKLITRIIGDVADSEPVQAALAGLDKEGAERLKGSPEFAQSLREFTVAKIGELSVTDQFADEEVESSYGYLSGYKPRGNTPDLVPQTNRLRELFSGIGYCNQDLLAKIQEGKVDLPKHAEGSFAIPNWMKNPQIFGDTYSAAVQKVLDTLKQTLKGKFYNYRDGQLNEQRLRQSARSQKFWKDLSDAQGNPDILIVPAQFGIRHRGRSVRRAREVFANNEFGLGAFATGIMLLTHPNRLQNVNDLWIDCAGDEYDDPVSDARFGQAPCFVWDGDEVRFGTRGVGGASECYGSSSGFVPQ